MIAQKINVRSSSMVNEILAIKNLKVTNEGGKILSSATVSLTEGEVIAIFGPGGSGKSLFLSFLNGHRSKDLIYSSDHCSQPDVKHYLNLNNYNGDPTTVPFAGRGLYLLDEPENGIRNSTFTDFVKVCKSVKTTLIYVTHHLDYIRNICNKIQVMRYGEDMGTHDHDDLFGSSDPYLQHISTMGC